MSAETRAKISAAKKAYFSDPANRKAMSDLQRKRYEENPALRREISERQKAFYSDPANRQKSSEAIRRSYRRLIEAQGSNGPTSKRCSLCEETKPLAAFSVKRNKLRCGFISVVADSRCKPCRAAAAKKRRDRMIAEGIDVNAIQRERLARRLATNPKARKAHRRRKREWATAKRRKEGRPSNGYSPKARQNSYAFLPTEPIARFLEERLRRESKGEITAATGVPERRLYGLCKRETPRVRMETVDMILTGLGCPEEMHRLYPDTSVGYHYLNPDGTPVLSESQV